MPAVLFLTNVNPFSFNSNPHSNQCQGLQSYSASVQLKPECQGLQNYSASVQLKPTLEPECPGSPELLRFRPTQTHTQTKVSRVSRVFWKKLSLGLESTTNFYSGGNNNWAARKTSRGFESQPEMGFPKKNWRPWISGVSVALS